MDIIEQSTDRLLDVLKRASAGKDEIGSVVHDFLERSKTSHHDLVYEAMHTLAKELRFLSVSQQGVLAVTLGALIEEGYDPAPMISPFLEQLSLYLGTVCPFAGGLLAAIATLQRQPG
jgi:hypothetical protein